MSLFIRMKGFDGSQSNDNVEKDDVYDPHT